MVKPKSRSRLISDSDSEVEVENRGAKDQLVIDDDHHVDADSNGDAPPVWTSPTSKKLAELGDSDDDSDQELTIRRRGRGHSHNNSSFMETDNHNESSSAANHVPMIESTRIDTGARNDSFVSGAGNSSAFGENENREVIYEENDEAADYEEIFADDEEINAAGLDMNVGAEELLNADQTETAAGAKKKRTIKKRQTLNAKLLIDPLKGLAALNKSCRKIKFQGKGHEEKDLENLLWNLEHWAHLLCPQMKFATFLENAERLGNKQEVKNFLRSVRSGEYHNGGIFDADSAEEDAENKNANKKKRQDLDFDDILMEEDDIMRQMATLDEASFGGYELDNHPAGGTANKSTIESQYSQPNNTLNTTTNSFQTSKLVTSTPYPKHLLPGVNAVPLIPTAVSLPSPLSEDVAKKIEEKRQLALAKRLEKEKLAKQQVISEQPLAPMTPVESM